MCRLIPTVHDSTSRCCYDAFGNLISEAQYADLLPVESSEVKTVTIEYAAFEPTAEPAYIGRYTYEKDHEAVELGYFDDRARCYDPTQGRWLDSSPLGFDLGDGNLFPYPGRD